jgi:Ca2+-dependent lipid-binding protein
MLGSILTVHVVEARDLRPMDMDGTSDPYVILQVEDQRIETNFKKSTLNPVWNESFTFEISHGREPLQIVVMDKDTFGKDDLEGMCEFPLVHLQDQMKHDQWIDLRDEQGQPSQGRIRLMLQWVYSKVQYFSEYLSKWDETLAKDIDEKEQIERFIKQLESPFGFLEA